jgi:hypothetical protein
MGFLYDVDVAMLNVAGSMTLLLEGSSQEDIHNLMTDGVKAFARTI